LHYLKTRNISIEKKKRWAEGYLDKELGKQFEIIRPRFPLSEDSKYNDWKINFERYIPFLKNNVILIGSSLGGIFLAKYLSENKFPKKILATYIICPPYDNTLPDEDLAGGFKLKDDLSLIEKNCKNTTFIFSKDDDVVPVSHAEKYKSKLKNKNLLFIKVKMVTSVFQNFQRLLR